MASETYYEIPEVHENASRDFIEQTERAIWAQKEVNTLKANQNR